MPSPDFSGLFKVLLCVVFLAGCNTTRHSKPEVELPEQFTTGSIPAKPENVNALAWWTGFDDPVLIGLVNSGLQENLSLKQASHRLDVARLKAKSSNSDWKPKLDVGGTAGSVGNSSSSATTDVNSSSAAGSLQFSWMPDIFGRRKNSRDRAWAEQEAALADLEAVKLAYIADIVSTYIDLKYYRSAIVIARENLRSYSNTMALTRTMRDAGVTDNLDVAQAQALVDAASAELPPLETQMHRSTNHLATLLGKPATEFSISLPEGTDQPRLKREIGIGIPVDLLRNRPDIRREEKLLAAAAANIGIAQSQLYPSLTLSGNIDMTAVLASGLSATNIGWAFGSSIVAPILDGGRLRTEIDIAEAESRLQYSRWRESVLEAVEEVENALVAVHRGTAEEVAQNRKVSSYLRALNLARESYKGGASVVLDVLEANRSLGKARLDLAASRRKTANAYVDLYIAVGGGATVLVDSRVLLQTLHSANPK